jgi:hypothetical protein
MPREAGCLAEENIGYENSSRIEQKRSHQWLMDTGEPGMFSNKKQAVEAVSDRPISAVNVSQWDTGLGFHPLTGQFSDRLFGSDLIRSVNSVDKNTPSVGSGNPNMGIKDFGNQYGIDPSVRLSISSSCLNFGGIRKVKVNQVRDSDHGMPAASIGHSYSMSDKNAFSIGSDYNKNGGNITSGSTYNNGSDNTVANENLFSTGHIFNKGDRSFLLMGHNYGRGDESESVLSINRSFDRGDGNFVTMGQTYGKDDGNLISLGTSYSKGNESFTSMGPTYGKSGQTFTTVPSSDAGNSSSFGGFHVDPEQIPSGGIINSSNPLISNQNSAQGVDSQKDLTESNPDPLVNITQKHNAKNDTVVKNIEPNPTKKTSNKFPTNVKSLLSTGIFDGIPIKYCTWSREVNRVLILSCLAFEPL